MSIDEDDEVNNEDLQVPEEGKMGQIDYPSMQVKDLQKKGSSFGDIESEISKIHLFRAVKLKARLKEVKSQLFHNKEILCLEMYEDVPQNQNLSEHIDHPGEHHQEDMSLESKGETKLEDSNKHRTTSRLSGDTSQLPQNISAGMAKKLKEKKLEEQQKIIQIRNSFESKEYPKEFRYFQLLICVAVLAFVIWMYFDQLENANVLSSFALHSQKLVYIKLLERQQMTIGNRGRTTFLSKIKPATQMYKMVYN